MMPPRPRRALALLLFLFCVGLGLIWTGIHDRSAPVLCKGADIDPVTNEDMGEEMTPAYTCYLNPETPRTYDQMKSRQREEADAMTASGGLLLTAVAYSGWRRRHTAAPPCPRRAAGKC